MVSEGMIMEGLSEEATFEKDLKGERRVLRRGWGTVGAKALGQDTAWG